MAASIVGKLAIAERVYCGDGAWTSDRVTVLSVAGTKVRVKSNDKPTGKATYTVARKTLRFFDWATREKEMAAEKKADAVKFKAARVAFKALAIDTVPGMTDAKYEKLVKRGVSFINVGIDWKKVAGLTFKYEYDSCGPAGVKLKGGDWQPLYFQLGDKPSWSHNGDHYPWNIAWVPLSQVEKIAKQFRLPLGEI